MGWPTTSFLKIPVGSQALAACLHTPAGPDPPWPLAICCHGLTGTRFGSCYRFVQLASALARQGAACLRFDFRGCGESDGRFVDVTLTTLQEDLVAAIRAMDGTEGCDTSRLALVGSSFGAFTAARVTPGLGPAVRALVLIAPVSRPGVLIERGMTESAWQHLRDRGWIDHHGMPLGRGFIDQAMKADGPSALADLKASLLIFHGAGDRDVPIDQGRAYASAARSAGSSVQFIEVDSNDHGMRGVEHTRLIVDTSASFILSHLQPGN